jgi:hypothetical protein
MSKEAAVALAALAMILGVPSSADATPNVSAESPVPWLKATPGNAPGFAELAKTVVSDNGLSYLREVLPYSVVLTNCGSAAVVGIGMRFEITNADKTVHRDFFYYSFPNPKIPMMPVGSSRLFTPFSRTNDIAHGRQQAPASLARSADDAATLESFGSATGFRAIVDLVITEGGQVAGADTAHNVQQLTSQAQAHYNLTRDATARLNREPDAEVIKWLTALAQQPLPSMLPGKVTDRTAETQKTLAAGWLKQMQTGRRGELLQYLNSVTKMEDSTLTFLKSLRGGLR